MKKLFYLILLLSAISCKYEFKRYKHRDKMYKIQRNFLFKNGDNPLWATKDFDDSNWNIENKVPKGDDIFWTRKIINITEVPDSLQLIGININAFGAYEVFWDGVLIGRNGKPGNELNNEKTGRTTDRYLIPNNLLELGNHTLALRMSQLYEKGAPRGIYIYIKDYNELVTDKLKDTIYINILAGAFLLATIYYFFLYISDRKQYTMLLFSISSFLFFLLIILEYIKFYIPIHYSHFVLRLEAIGYLTLFISFIVPYYFSVQFTFPFRKWFFLAYSIFLIWIHQYYSHSYDYTALFLAQMMWLSSTLIICYAIYKKQKAAIVVLFGLLLSFTVYKISIFDVSLFVSFAIISLCMFYILSIKLKEQRLAFEHTIAESTRLKYELLKKKIQPHFLMNTLTSLIDWVEEAPDKGVEFIEALAGEFDLLNQVENETLIPISQEIKLCKSHLNIMRYRKEIEYLWEDEGVLNDDSQTIPPAIIHTLLENSITHCLPLKNNSMRFKLVVETSDNKQKYTFLTYAKVRNSQKDRSDGTGFKYIKARLTESYKNNWNFSSEPTENGWKNVITIIK
ncbi:histidine kinase [Tenacibaculum aiptasiae]|uniref:histidine kinase n=1 Tax=Tenacibaculum aiptasiae TaxID=426481 RepID=UPI00232BE2DF|nr:sensor histidine kinase [Tenacibaculum aiptasiae]